MRDEFDRVLKSPAYNGESMLSENVYSDLHLFNRTLQLAVTAAAKHKDTSSGGTPRSNAHQGEEAPARQQMHDPLKYNYHKKLSSAGNAPVPCSKCNLHKCPHAKAHFEKCDVCDGEPSPKAQGGDGSLLLHGGHEARLDGQAGDCWFHFSCHQA